jgi:hypothetical protein
LAYPSKLSHALPSKAHNNTLQYLELAESTSE